MINTLKVLSVVTVQLINSINIREQSEAERLLTPEHVSNTACFSVKA